MTMYRMLLTVDGKPLKFISLPIVPRQHDIIEVGGCSYSVWLVELKDGDPAIIVDASKNI